LFIFSSLIFFSARLSKNIKISTFEKVSKRSHFRPDNQRQISLDLSHFCRYRMLLISLVNFATFFKFMSLARYEYSRYEARRSFICEMCFCISEMCLCISRSVYVFVLKKNYFRKRKTKKKLNQNWNIKKSRN
jgi:hypothetical protein